MTILMDLIAVDEMGVRQGGEDEAVVGRSII